MTASFNGHLDIVKTLIKAGAKFNQTDKVCSPWHYSNYFIPVLCTSVVLDTTLKYLTFFFASTCTYMHYESNVHVCCQESSGLLRAGTGP